jgi:hypothetical protein
MNNVQSLQTVVTLANAAELASVIAAGVLGNDVSDVVEGKVLNSNVVRDLTLANVQSAFIGAQGGVNA